MYKKSVYVLFLFLAAGSSAQKNITGLVDSERSFSSFTASHTIRQGFLRFLDSAGIIFINGEAKNGISIYGPAKDRPGILSWSPVFACISTGGDFGFTTGPYEFRSNSPQDKPVAKGSFATIWHTDANGNWKFLCDLGTGYQDNYKVPAKIKELNISTMKGAAIGSFEDALETDKKINDIIRQNNTASLATYLTADSWVNLNDQLPAAGSQEIMAAMKKVPAGLALEPVGGQLSPRKDMAYVYGKTRNGQDNGNYIRVWTQRNKQWILLLQVLAW